MDGDLVIVMLRDEDWLYADKVARLVATPAQLGSLLGMNDPKKLLHCVDCPTCKAPTLADCRTRTGGTVTRMHKNRMRLFLAVTHAISTEIVIQEEEHIEDFL